MLLFLPSCSLPSYLILTPSPLPLCFAHTWGWILHSSPQGFPTFLGTSASFPLRRLPRHSYLECCWQRVLPAAWAHFSLAQSSLSFGGFVLLACHRLFFALQVHGTLVRWVPHFRPFSVCPLFPHYAVPLSSFPDGGVQHALVSR